MKFSERMGFKPVKNIIQVASMDNELRNSLWNNLSRYYWGNIHSNTLFGFSSDQSPYDTKEFELIMLITRIWIDYFKLPIDEIPPIWRARHSDKDMHNKIKSYLFECKWYEVYDFIEFVPNNYYSTYYRDNNKNFIMSCNDIMKRELSAYRFVDGKIVAITSEEEINSIEEAITITDQFKPVSFHLKQALDLFADRKSPDYRNSIKESISAVEALCKLIAGENKATLSTALKKLEDKVDLHPALRQAFDKLYGYTSDADGIRHALLDEVTLGFEDARFMLIACSAFINYLKEKSVNSLSRH